MLEAPDLGYNLRFKDFGSYLFKNQDLQSAFFFFLEALGCRVNPLRTDF